MESAFGELPVEELVFVQTPDSSSRLAGPASEVDSTARVDSSNKGQEKTTCAQSVRGGPHRAQY